MVCTTAAETKQRHLLNQILSFENSKLNKIPRQLEVSRNQTKMGLWKAPLFNDVWELCMWVCVPVFMYVWAMLYVHMYTCVHVYICVCMYAYMCTRLCVCGMCMLYVLLVHVCVLLEIELRASLLLSKLLPPSYTSYSQILFEAPKYIHTSELHLVFIASTRKTQITMLI